RAGYRARLVAPLLHGNEVVGLLVVRRKTPGAFPQNTVDLTFAAQSVLAIQNARLFDGGSADLASSNRTEHKFTGAGEFEPDTPEGRNIHFGIREHAMAAIVNGLSLSKLYGRGRTMGAG